MSPVPDSPPTLAKLIELLSKLIELIAASVRVPAPAPPPRRPLVCTYCSSARHLIRHCPRVLSDIRSGICKRNARGRVVLPSGLYVPHNVVGPNLRARLLAHTRTQQLLTPPVVRHPVPIVAPPPVPPSTTPPVPPPVTYRAPVVSHKHIPNYVPPSRYVVGRRPDKRSSRLPSSSALLDVRTVPVASNVGVTPVVQPSSTPPIPPPDFLEDALRELAVLRLHPDPSRFTALERRVAQLRDSI